MVFYLYCYSKLYLKPSGVTYFWIICKLLHKIEYFAPVSFWSRLNEMTSFSSIASILFKISIFYASLLFHYITWSYLSNSSLTSIGYCNPLLCFLCTWRNSFFLVQYTQCKDCRALTSSGFPMVLSFSFYLCALLTGILTKHLFSWMWELKLIKNSTNIEQLQWILSQKWDFAEILLVYSANSLLNFKIWKEPGSYSNWYVN